MTEERRVKVLCVRGRIDPDALHELVEAVRRLDLPQPQDDAQTRPFLTPVTADVLRKSAGQP